MDISSKYFSLLQRPTAHSLKFFWSFIADVYRTGKIRELMSFIVWELGHRTGYFSITNKYLKFTEDLPYILSDLNQNLADGLLVDKGMSVEPVAVDWKFCSQTTDGALWGCRYGHLTALYRSINQSQSAIFVCEFQHPITSLFISRTNQLFVCSNGAIYKSSDQGNSFEIVLKLSTTSSYFLFNNGMTELPDHTLLIGEYGSIWHGKLWQNLAFLYYSYDGGNTWKKSDFLIEQGVNKHIHLVKYSSLLNAVLLTDGDNKKQIWINESLVQFSRQASQRQYGWHLINKYHHQMGGYMSMTEVNETLLLGSDYLGGTNFVITTSNGQPFEKAVLPDPYRRSPIMNMVTRWRPDGYEVWAVSYSCLSTNAKSLLMYSKDAGKSWIRVIEFDGTRHEIRLVSSFSNQSRLLYISLTEYGDDPRQHKHQLYKLD